MSSQRAARPLFKYGPAEALKDWKETIAQILADMAQLAVNEADKKELREQLHEMIDRSI